MKHMISNLLAKLRCQKGQGTVEYALVTLVVIAVLVAFLALNPNPLSAAFTTAFTKVGTAVTAVP